MYATAQELEEYAFERGITLDRDAGVLLTLANDYLVTQNLIIPDPVPEAIKTAQMVAAILIDSGEDLMAPQGQRVLSESVAGAVSVTYSDKGRQSTYYPQLVALLAPYKKSGSPFVFGVARG